METSILIDQIKNLNFIEPSDGWLVSYCQQVHVNNSKPCKIKNINKGLSKIFRVYSN